MINPIRLCNDLFNDEKLSDSNLNQFTEDHLVRLANNNPGAIYSMLIADTTNKYNAYYGKMGSEISQNNIKEGLTIAKRDARAAAEAKVSSLQGLIKFKFGETGQVYQEFFPQGMDYFYKAKDTDLVLRLNAFQSSAVAHLTADYPAEVSEFTALNTTFKNALIAQTNAFSLIDNIITGRHEDRKALTVQLTFNFLTIASNNIDKPDLFDDYYNAQYLPIDASDKTTTFNLLLAPGQLKNLLDASADINANTPMRATNTGSETIIVGFAAAADQKPATGKTLLPGETFVGKASDFGYVNGTVVFLNAANESAINPAQGVVEIRP